MILKEILETKQFVDFYESAIDFCQHIEHNKTQSSIDFIQITRLKLLSLYDAGLKLPDVEILLNAEFDKKLEEKEFEKTLFFISERIEKRYYWHVFNPTDEVDTEPVCGDLVDDLGDIYKDLKQSILIFKIGTNESQETAVWEFKFNFDKHWSDHCINALSAIHFFLQND